MEKKRASIYIDAFNLYYGVLKNTSYRWLNPVKLCELYYKQYEIVSAKYFTAIVKPRPGDPQQAVRQKMYIRALETLPQMDVIYGQFLSHPVTRPLASSWEEEKVEYVEVMRTEEKGSDVNIAAHLLIDAVEQRFDAAIVISNDSDLALPIEIVTEKFKKDVFVFSPAEKPSFRLRQVATMIKDIRKGALGRCQFPNELQDENGTFHKPEGW